MVDVTCFGPSSITGSAVALQYCKAHAKINRKMENSTPCKIVTPKNFNVKLCIRDYVGKATHHANFGSNRYSGGFSPYRTAEPIFTLYGSNDVFPPKEVPFGG